MRVTALLFSLGLILFSFGSVAGQGIYLDHVDGLNPDESIPVGATLTYHMRVVGDETAHLMLNNGFTFSSENVTWTGVTGEFVEPNIDAWFDFVKVINFWANGSVEDTVGIGLLSLFGTGMPAEYNNIMWTFTIGPVAGPGGAEITLDSSWYPPSNPWMWDVVGEDVAWGGPYIHAIEDGGGCTEPYVDFGEVEFALINVSYGLSPQTVEGDPPPVFSLPVAPVGMTIDPATGEINWLPTEVGIFDVTVAAINDCGTFEVSFQIEVMPSPDPYTYCTPQPTILKSIDLILYVHIVNENPDDVDLESIRVQSKIPPYAGVSLENGEIITTAFIMRFLGASGFRPVTADFEANYTVEYDKTDGSHPILTGDYSLKVYPGDVTFDGRCDMADVVLMSEFFFNDGDVCHFDQANPMPELMDINHDGALNPLDLRAVIDLVEL